VVADGSLQDRIACFQGVQHRLQGDRRIYFQRDLIARLRQVP
jgi:hypothetical protein